MSQGLKFVGLEQKIDDRTSYDVFSSSAPEFKDRFGISFDLALYPASEIGYIVRVKNEKGDEVYNLFYDGQGDNLLFRLNYEGHYTLIRAEVDKAVLDEQSWLNMTLDFDMSRDSVYMTIGKETFAAADTTLPDRFYPDINFGKSDYIIDVPSFAIKNLSVEGRRKKWHFPLDELSGDAVHDAKGRQKGTAVNPEWLMSDSFNWKELVTLNLSSVACSGYDPETKDIYYFSRDSLYRYNVKTGELKTSVFNNTCPVDLTLGTSFSDAIYDRVFAYEVYYESSRDICTVASLDFNTLTWTEQSHDRLPQQMHHHGSFFDPSRARYTIFGGFGNMHYNGIFYTYDLNSGQWYTFQDVSGDKIYPRYFTSLGCDKQTNTLYLYGGMGNESGEQVVGRRYFYDFYSMELGTGVVKRLWSADLGSDKNMVPVRNLVLTGDGYFYTLCYPESYTESALQMYRFSMENGDNETLASEIPIQSDKINTNANLYYDSHLEKMFVTVQEYDDDICSTLKVYSLSLLRVTDEASAAYYDKIAAGKDLGGGLLIWIISISVLLVAAFAVILFEKRRRRMRKAGTDIALLPLVKGSQDFPKKNSILLFGDLIAYDRDGVSVSEMFAPRQMQVFCLILQHSVGGRGVHRSKLNALLWPGKSEDKVKSLRGVAMNQLRKFLSCMDDVDVLYEGGCYRIVAGPGFYCDYIRLIEILTSDTEDDNSEELINILSHGKFLGFVDDSIFDTFKEEVERIIEPAAAAEIAKRYEARDFQAVVDLADAIFCIDPVNGMALSFLIKALRRLRRSDEAMLRYQAFSAEYRKMYDTEYPLSFDSF